MAARGGILPTTGGVVWTSFEMGSGSQAQRSAPDDRGGVFNIRYRPEIHFPSITQYVTLVVP
jgi:hypothetical protein